MLEAASAQGAAAILPLSQARISSIHIRCCFGGYDKLGAAYAGGMLNDGPMSSAFSLGASVADIHVLARRSNNKPAYISEGHSGEGSAELAGLLAAKCRQAA
jgi:hypothetical protein